MMTGIDDRTGASASADRPGPRARGPGRVSTTVFGAGQSGAGDPGLLPASLLLRARTREPDETPPAGADTNAADLFEVVVADGDGCEISVLGPFDDEDAVAIWRSLGATSGLPLVVGGRDGHMHAFAQIGRLLLGLSHGRRRVGTLTGRRPRFLMRRKSARLPRRPLIYREPELVGGRDAR